jgi:NADH:ubiquinone oxidoreductase subunit 6 (subunit J)
MVMNESNEKNFEETELMNHHLPQISISKINEHEMESQKQIAIHFKQTYFYPVSLPSLLVMLTALVSHIVL